MQGWTVEKASLVDRPDNTKQFVIVVEQRLENEREESRTYRFDFSREQYLSFAGDILAAFELPPELRRSDPVHAALSRIERLLKQQSGK